MSTPAVILVINCGSSSIKFALFSADEILTQIFTGALDQIGRSGSTFRMKDAAGNVLVDAHPALTSLTEAWRLLIKTAEDHLAGSRLLAVGHRIVHGGADCDCPLAGTKASEECLQRLVPLAPLYLPDNIAGIAAVRELDSDLPHVACFDTAFHHSLPRLARLTTLPHAWQDEGIRRYGFHGLSYEYIVHVLRQDDVDLAHERVIVAHLGNGASMCALRGGRSVETTMGFTTLAGLMMGTRSGDLDPGAVLYLLTAKGLKPQEAQQILYERSGLLGVSGHSSEMRELLNRHDDPRAQDAVDLFCYRARHHLAALTAVLGGLDRVVFTGGRGANAPDVRERICDGLGYLGVVIDSEANRAGAKTVSRIGAAVTVQALLSNEELMIARHALRLTAGPAAKVEA